MLKQAEMRSQECVEQLDGEVVHPVPDHSVPYLSDPCIF